MIKSPIHQKSHFPFGQMAVFAFILSVFLSAFLLFQIQPIIARYILPKYGGSSSVWSACMLFFQLGLVVGYGYAHLIVTTLRDRRTLQIGIHFSLLILAVTTLPIVPDLKINPDLKETLPILGIMKLLVQSVGLPYVILSASGPLVQHWFSKVYPDRSPFRLYAISNVGSLLALLSYPFLFEVYLSISKQSLLWSGVFVIYALILSATAFIFFKSREVPAKAIGSTAIATGANAGNVPTKSHYLLWILFSACGSVLLLAVTNQICQDVTVVPFFWVIPLSLYLLSFIIAFDHSRWYFRNLFIPVTALLVGLILFYSMQKTGFAAWSLIWQVTIYSSTLFFACMVCHGEIVRLKPNSKFLTGFYLAIAAGGALGGIFVNLVAPRIFDSYYELHIGILLLAILITWQILPTLLAQIRRFLPTSRKPWFSRMAVGGVSFIWCSALGLIIFSFYLYVQKEREGVISSSRGFFGVLKVKEFRAHTGQNYRALFDGQIQHGLQFTSPDLRRIPTTYYNQNSGIGSTFKFMPRRIEGRKVALHVGVIGLGIGTVATYALPGDQFRFYEINPQVIDEAYKHFTFLEDCQGEVEVILGDGRISLQRELAQGVRNDFDILIIDAFSGDSIPMHLLTIEAFEVYGRCLKKGGVIAVHISNKHIDLSDPLRKVAKEFRCAALRLGASADKGFGFASEWVIMTKSRYMVDQLIQEGLVYNWERKEPKDILWTDGFGNLLEAFK